MTPEEMERAIEIGAEMVQLAYQEGTNIISFGELGMANTSASSVWMYFFTGIPLKECVGAGSGLDNQGIEHKISGTETGHRQLSGKRYGRRYPALVRRL